MAIQFGVNAQQTASTQPETKTKKPVAKAWVNVGYEANDPETGEKIFLGLPMGIPLDTMEVRSPGGSKILQAKADFHAKLTEFVMAMAPGEEEIVLDLKVQVRRTLEREAADASNNDFIAAAAQLSFAQKKVG